MNTNLKTDHISYDGWTREWSTKNSKYFWFNSTTGSSVWEDPVWSINIFQKTNTQIWRNKITDQMKWVDPWLLQMSPLAASPPSPAPAASPAPEQVWGSDIYARNQQSPPVASASANPDPLEWRANISPPSANK